MSYLLSADTILCALDPPERLRATEIWLMGAALSLWNERRGGRRPIDRLADRFR